MRGGVLTKTTDEPIDDQISRILSNSTFRLVSHGTYGFVYTVTYQGEDSGFMDFEHDTMAKTFIIKLVPLDMRMSHRVDGKISRSSDLIYLKREVIFQRKVYKQSLEKHQCAPCPAVLYDFIYTAPELEQIFPDVFSYYYVGSELEPGPFIPKEERDDLRIGVIFMEFINGPSGAVTLEEAVMSDPTLEQRKSAEAARLYCMVLECGVDHRDAHMKNFLLNERGELKIIDFGVAEEISPKETDQYRRWIKECEEGYCTELQKAIRSANPSFWFLKHFSIGPLPRKIDKAALCKDGLCTKEINVRHEEERQSEMKAREQERVRAQERETMMVKRAYKNEAKYDEQTKGMDPREATLFRASMREHETYEPETYEPADIPDPPKAKRVLTEIPKNAREKTAQEKLQQQGEAKRLLAEQKQRALLLETKREPMIPLSNLTTSTLKQLKEEIIHLKGYLPTLKDLIPFSTVTSKFLSEEKEKNIYISYLSKIHEKRGGTRKRRRKYTKKISQF